MRDYEVETEVFSVSQGEWRVRIGMEVLKAAWPDKGAALAGLATECRRLGIHKLSKDCWCNPEILGADENSKSLSALQEAFAKVQAAYAALENAPTTAPVGQFLHRLNVRHQFAHAAADAFWAHWRHYGETHKHGYYESTWGAINKALELVGVVQPGPVGAAGVPESLTDSQIRDALKTAVENEGSQKEAAAKIGISAQYLSDIMQHKRHIPSAVASWLGYRRVRMYVRKDICE